MFTRLTAFLVLACNFSFGQVEGVRSQTKFDKFIAHSKVTWAAYVPDTVWYDKYNLTDVLLDRFKKNDIKISSPLSRDSLMTANKLSYLDKAALEQRSYPPGHSGKATNRVDSNSGFIHAEQILYVANGKLYSYIPWVSPKISVYTSNNNFIGTTEYFSSSINTKYNFKSSKRDNIKFIKSTKRKIVLDTMPRTSMLKQVYGFNILEATWKDILNEQNQVIDLRSGQNITLKNVKEFPFINTIHIPVYDSLGNILGIKSYTEPISPSLFQQIEISQNWFYNYSKNVVVNTITDITLFVRNKGQRNDLLPAYKIIFK